MTDYSVNAHIDPDNNFWSFVSQTLLKANGVYT